MKQNADEILEQSQTSTAPKLEQVTRKCGDRLITNMQHESARTIKDRQYETARTMMDRQHESARTMKDRQHETERTE